MAWESNANSLKNNRLRQSRDQPAAAYSIDSATAPGLALEEILVNVIRYGDPEGRKYEILVWLSLEQDCVIATVESRLC